jgi:hypothetical protein
MTKDVIDPLAIPADRGQAMSTPDEPWRTAAQFLLWQYDRKGPLAESHEAWEQLRASLATPSTPGVREALEADYAAADDVIEAFCSQSIGIVGHDVGTVREILAKAFASRAALSAKEQGR